MIARTRVWEIVLATLAFGCAMLAFSQAVPAETNRDPIELEVIFQNGDAYSAVQCDSDSHEMNVTVKVKKRTSAGRHLRFGNLGEWIKGEKVEIVDVQLQLYYVDEYWSKLRYHVAVSRSLDGTVNNISPDVKGTFVISGDKFTGSEKTERPGWINIPISPYLIQDWVDNERDNHGLVLHVPKVNRGEDGELVNLGLDQSTSGPLFVGFRSCKNPGDGKTPKLVVRYRVIGNAPPSPPLIDASDRVRSIYSEAIINWPESQDPNAGDQVRYEFQTGYSDGTDVVWADTSVQLSKAETIWHSSADYERFYADSNLPKHEQLIWYRVRSIDNNGAYSRWSVSGPLMLTDRPWTVWGTDGSRKIWPDTEPGPEGESAVFIKAARNEWEPIQVAVAGHTNLHGVSIRATALEDGSGNKIQPATIFRQHYVPVSSTANPKYGRLGMVPDGLVPLVHPLTGKPTGGLYGGNVFNVPSGGREVFWLDIYVPSDAPAGIYQGSVVVTADGVEDVTLPVNLEVFDFTLASPKHLMAAFQLSPSGVRHSHPTLRKTKDNKQAVVDLTHLYEEMLHEHYINNWSPITGFNYGLNRAKVSINDGRVTVDWTEFDKLVGPYMNGTAYKDGIPAQTLFVPYWIPVKKPNSDKWANKVTRNNYQNIDVGLFAQYIKEVERHMKERGWLDRAFVFYFDEPFISSWKYAAFLQTSKVIREHAPSLRIMITDGYKGPKAYKKWSYIDEPIEDYVDTWNPVTFQVSSLELAEYYRNRKAAGNFDIWNQTLANANPRRAVINLFPEYDLPFHRMWGILSWNFGFQGIEWWSTIVWWDKKARQRLDPWTNPKAFPGFRQPLNSDGRLFFPGTDEAIGGPDTPVSSIRMKAVREAIEDYEYLYMLDQLGGSDEFDINILHTTDNDRSLAMTSAMPMGKGPWQWWEGDPDVFMQARETLARLIVKHQNSR